MKTIAYRNTDRFSSLFYDYIENKAKLKKYYHRKASEKEILAQIQAKQKQKIDRKTLQKVIKKQLQQLQLSEETIHNLKMLCHAKTFSICTGHQLNLATGPMFFVYKILSVIQMAATLKKKFPDYHFVPIYWMASEDHDFQEINHFYFQNQKLKWESNQQGAVGPFETKDLKLVFDELQKLLPTGKRGEYLKNLFYNAYIKHHSLTEASRYLVNELFTDYGLITLDPTDKELKRLFIPYMKQEILSNTYNEKIEQTSEQLKKDYKKVQIKAAPINLFYLHEDSRTYVTHYQEQYYLKEGQQTIRLKKEELLQKLEENPEQFSPNVALRPLYQEVILPNLCYVGGGAELAYWMQLKASFDTQKIPFPIVCPRQSFLIIPKHIERLIKQLQLSGKELFEPQEQLLQKKILQQSELDIESLFEEKKLEMEALFSSLESIAVKTEATFINALKATHKKQTNSLQQLKKKLIKAEKRKLHQIQDQLQRIHQSLFPQKQLQERSLNFFELYTEYGPKLIEQLLKQTPDHTKEFIILNHRDLETN